MKTRTVKYIVKYRNNYIKKIHERYGMRIYTYKSEKDLMLQIINDLLMSENVSKIISLEIELEKRIELKITS